MNFILLFSVFCSQFDADNMYMNDSNQEFRSPNQVRQLMSFPINLPG